MSALIPAGFGAVFVWSTLNQLLRGDASLGRVALAGAVLVGVAVLLFVTYRFISAFEESR